MTFLDLSCILIYFEGISIEEKKEKEEKLIVRKKLRQKKVDLILKVFEEMKEDKMTWSISVA